MQQTTMHETGHNDPCQPSTSAHPTRTIPNRAIRTTTPSIHLFLPAHPVLVTKIRPTTNTSYHKRHQHHCPCHGALSQATNCHSLTYRILLHIHICGSPLSCHWMFSCSIVSISVIPFSLAQKFFFCPVISQSPLSLVCRDKRCVHPPLPLQFRAFSHRHGVSFFGFSFFKFSFFEPSLV
ncbi:hypothetical protein BDV97DRAFT_49787 [Delphinella strobiligena]|nr:hypothetical protein BDV97DRAFT_49787 [Delphinella strobiligena]